MADSAAKPSFLIKTLGCKVNHCESETLARQFEEAGWQSARADRGADICIINTCTVTHKASMQSRQLVRQAVRSHTDARIVVTGCYAQTEPEVLRQIEGVDVVLSRSPDDRAGWLTRYLGAPGPYPASGFQEENPERDGLAAINGLARSRPLIKIQDGCNAFCTYCIVPHARGRSRSVPMDEVVSTIQKWQSAGFFELVLTGIHIGAYGKDLSPPMDLHTLLARIADMAAQGRLRLSSIEPHELSDPILELVASRDLFCKHFHIPLQSGDDRILIKMGRPYRQADYVMRVEKIQALMPEAAIGADILVGFPGESEAAFENTYRLAEKLPLAYLHVFPFSARPGTPAAGFPNQNSPQVIKRRCAHLRVLSDRKKAVFRQAAVGQRYTVVIENKRDKTTGLLKGLTTNYIPVLIKGSDRYKNKVCEVTIERIDAQLNAMGSVHP